MAADVEGVPNTTHMHEIGAYNSGKYSSYFGSWADAVAQANISDQEFTDDESDDVTVSNDQTTSGQPQDTQASKDGVLDEIVSAFNEDLG